MKVKSESEVAQSCPTLSDPMNCSLPGSCIHGIFQARVLEWGAMALSSPDSWSNLILGVFLRVFLHQCMSASLVTSAVSDSEGQPGEPTTASETHPESALPSVGDMLKRTSVQLSSLGHTCPSLYPDPEAGAGLDGEGC